MNYERDAWGDQGKLFNKGVGGRREGGRMEDGRMEEWKNGGIRDISQ